MKIVLDLKNLALYSGGIAHWLSDFLPAWIKSQPNQCFIGLMPEGCSTKSVQLKDVIKHSLPWRACVPRQLRHLLYDNWFFPRALRTMEPDLLFSPYHDVRLPQKGSSIFTVITIHDLCFFEVPHAYPWAIRFYYRLMLRINLTRTNHILTVSEATRKKLVKQFLVKEEDISVVPNAISSDFLQYQPTQVEIEKFREKVSANPSKLLLYSGGIEYRKNIPKLLEALRQLWSSGNVITLCITGNLNLQWKFLFTEEELSKKKVHFLGRLSMDEMRIAYEAADAIVYPSLCEGFGRPCLEAMAVGAPLACSNLPVFQEVVDNYANYFDPNDAQAIASSISLSLLEGRKKSYIDPRYEISAVQAQFARVMSSLCEHANHLKNDKKIT